MVLIYQPPNAHVHISWILLRNAMAAVAVKKIYIGKTFLKTHHQWRLIRSLKIKLCILWDLLCPKVHVAAIAVSESR
jgi:hypothetical protein